MLATWKGNITERNMAITQASTMKQFTCAGYGLSNFNSSTLYTCQKAMTRHQCAWSSLSNAQHEKCKWKNVASWKRLTNKKRKQAKMSTLKVALICTADYTDNILISYHAESWKTTAVVQHKYLQPVSSPTAFEYTLYLPGFYPTVEYVPTTAP